MTTTGDSVPIADLNVLAAWHDPSLAGLPALNLGCGLDHDDHAINIDIAPLPGVDLVADLDDKWPLASDSARYIKASHVFEHVRDPILFMTEAWRVLAPGGLLDIRVPYYLHRNSYTDPTHVRHCTEQTFCYWIDGQGFQQVFGPAMGSPPAVFAGERMCLNGQEQEELQVILRKLTESQAG